MLFLCLLKFFRFRLQHIFTLYPLIGIFLLLHLDNLSCKVWLPKTLTARFVISNIRLIQWVNFLAIFDVVQFLNPLLIFPYISTYNVLQVKTASYCGFLQCFNLKIPGHLVLYLIQFVAPVLRGKVHGLLSFSLFEGLV